MIKYTYDPPYNHWSGNRTGNTNKWKIVYKGSVPTVDDLPAEGEFVGEVYNVLEDSKYYMWNGSSWEEFSVNTYIGATSSSDGIQGLVPPATSNQIYNVLTGGGTWETAESLGIALDNNVLHKTGVETVTGEKVFSGIQTTAAGNESALMVVKDPVLVKDETPESVHFLSLGLIDSTGNSYAQDQEARLGVFEYRSPSVSSPISYVQIVDFGFYEGATSALIRVGHDENGIRFADAPATSNERTASTDIITRGYLTASEWNWQKTLKAESVTFAPVPESDLEPVVDFIFTETLPAEGEKGPDNPSAIAGVSSITVTHCQRRGVASTNYTIPLGDTYYGGSLDVAAGVLTVTWKSKVFDGTEDWQLAPNVITGYNVFYYTGFYVDETSEASTATQICTHYSLLGNLTSASNHFYISSNRTWFVSTEQSVDDFKAFLAQQNSLGTPVTVVCRDGSQTIQLSPTQIRSLSVLNKYEPRINTVYTDQEAVQVGYQRFYDENRLVAIEARLEALEASQG